MNVDFNPRAAVACLTTVETKNTNNKFRCKSETKDRYSATTGFESYSDWDGVLLKSKNSHGVLGVYYTFYSMYTTPTASSETTHTCMNTTAMSKSVGLLFQ
jgi:hypothetical protein